MHVQQADGGHARTNNTDIHFGEGEHDDVPFVPGRVLAPGKLGQESQADDADDGEANQLIMMSDSYKGET